MGSSGTDLLQAGCSITQPTMSRQLWKLEAVIPMSENHSLAALFIMLATSSVNTMHHRSGVRLSHLFPTLTGRVAHTQRVRITKQTDSGVQ